VAMKIFAREAKNVLARSDQIGTIIPNWNATNAVVEKSFRCLSSRDGF